MRNRYATLSDNDLNTMVSSCTEQNRMIGCNSILAQLQASGVWVQRHRRARVDPIGVALKWSTSVQRRRYSVPAPNLLWHIDVNHKLIRYFSVIILIIKLIVIIIIDTEFLFMEE